MVGMKVLSDVRRSSTKNDTSTLVKMPTFPVVFLLQFIMCSNIVSGDAFTVSVGGSASVDVFHESGYSQSFSNCGATDCTADFGASRVISVRATATDYRGFILYAVHVFILLKELQ